MQTWAMSQDYSENPPMSQRYLPQNFRQVFFFFFLSEKVNLITVCTLTQTWAMSKNSSEYAPMSQRYLPSKKIFFFFFLTGKLISHQCMHLGAKHGQCHRIVLNTLSCLIGKMLNIFCTVLFFFLLLLKSRIPITVSKWCKNAQWSCRIVKNIHWYIFVLFFS